MGHPVALNVHYYLNSVEVVAFEGENAASELMKLAVHVLVICVD